MEETNYDRKTVGIVEVGSSPQTPPVAETEGSEDMKKSPVSPETHSIETGLTRYSKKTFLQKLSIKDKPRPQRMPYRMLLSLRLVSWPVVFYAGFSYGSYLIW